ncbi:MAG TPA: carboxypeptidase-like regulatory domain-containing protein [Flavitalea sp.]|nr:carboxypeptidase-like regulatory domain-containing protein [Flavitalea sp.]
MKRAKNPFVFFVFLLFSLQNSFPGESLPPITVKVTSETGVALAGVNVAPKGNSATGTTTNNNGAFSINVPGGTKILVFSYVVFGIVQHSHLRTT